MKPIRSISLAALALVGAAALLSGCGGAKTGTGTGSEPAAPTWATGAEDVVVDVFPGVGYVPLEYGVGQPPAFRLYGDGTVVVPAPGEREAVRIPALETYRLSNAGVRAVLAAAAEAGLLTRELDYGQPGVTDHGTTTVTVTVDGRTFSQSAYALGVEVEGDGGVTSEQRELRQALSGFVELVERLPEQHPDLLAAPPRPYEPDAVEAYAFGTEAAGDRTLDWPGRALSEDAAGGGTECRVIRGAELGEVVRALDAVPASTWLTWRSAGSLWTVGFRVVLPGERPCSA